HPLTQKAQVQLAEVSKERHDPLALLLMRDGRPQVNAPAPSTETAETAENRLKNVTLVAKHEVVHEEPGDEKGFLRRMADKLNPFAPSPPKKQENEMKREARSQVAKGTVEEAESPGFFASLRGGFGLFSKEDKAKLSANRDPQLTTNIDASLQQRGVTLDRMATLQPPPSDVAKAAETKVSPPPTDTGALLSGVDTKLKQEGKTADALPPTPEIAVGLRGPAPTETSEQPVARKPAPTSDTAALLSGVDAGLKDRGIAPSRFEVAPPPSSEAKQTAAPKRPARVELDTNLTLEKGPLFLDASEVKLPEKPSEPGTKPQQAEKTNTLSENLVKGAQPAPQQQKPAETVETKTAAQKRKPDLFEEEEEKGFIEQLRDTANTIGNVLNPLKW
ncbi:MAG: hypothetical protein ACREQK_04665, partial [Candidatus Binatia bacterium]